MADCEIKKIAHEKITAITAGLDEVLIKKRIDGPIDTAAKDFRYQTKLPLDYKQIHTIFSDFVRNIYENGLQTDWAIPDPLAEAIMLLEDYYQGTYANGYSAAMLDAGDTEYGGIDIVLNRLAEIIKTIERQKYFSGVFVRHINPCDWHLKREIAGILLEQYRPVLPPLMRNCAAAQLVDQIPALMALYLNSCATLQQMSILPKKEANS